MTEPKVRVENLKKHFSSDVDLLSRLFGTGEPEMVKAVDGVSFEIQPGEAFGIAGESGCGKTTLGKTILKLYEATDGDIYFDGVNITEETDIGDQHFRTAAQLIQQDPYKSLNPRFRVVDWLKEPLDIHDIGTAEERTNRVMETLEDVGLSPAEAYAYEYPSELSGGERQRVGIGRAIILNPSFVVADEPVSMLDVSVRASVLSLLNELQREMGLATLYISHDLSLLKHMCDRLAIMYLGRIVEIGPAEEVIDNPQHPYTKALVSSTPIIDPDKKRERIDIEGEIPDPVNLPSGCRFAPRCPNRIDECTKAEPGLYRSGEQQARCLLHDEDIDAEYGDDSVVITDTSD